MVECACPFPDQIRKLSALGFHPDDCKAALAHCNGHLDDAALWLTHHADLADTAVQGKEYVDDNHSILSFNTVEVHYGYTDEKYTCSLNCRCAHMCMWACVCVCVCVFVLGNRIRSLLHSSDVLEADFSLEVGFCDPTYFLVFFSPSGHVPS